MSKAEMAEEYMPFGRIKKDTLIEARKILQTVGSVTLVYYGVIYLHNYASFHVSSGQHF